MRRWSIKSTLLAVGAGALLSVPAPLMMAAETEWGPSRVKDCNRECLATKPSANPRPAAV